MLCFNKLHIIIFQIHNPSCQSQKTYSIFDCQLTDFLFPVNDSINMNHILRIHTIFFSLENAALTIPSVFLHQILLLPDMSGIFLQCFPESSGLTASYQNTPWKPAKVPHSPNTHSLSDNLSIPEFYTIIH